MAEPDEITEELERLALHCRPPLMSVDDRVRWMADWCEDLGAFDIEAIRTACKRWRESADPKFPRQGQLIPMVRAARSSTGVASDKPQPWRPLSDEKYEALTLSEKVRHHRIMASEAYSKAGPQGLNTLPQDMPPRWHEWRARAAGHVAEAQRLQSLLKEAQRLHLGARQLVDA